MYFRSVFLDFVDIELNLSHSEPLYLFKNKMNSIGGLKALTLQGNSRLMHKRHGVAEMHGIGCCVTRKKGFYSYKVHSTASIRSFRMGVVRNGTALWDIFYLFIPSYHIGSFLTQIF